MKLCNIHWKQRVILSYTIEMVYLNPIYLQVVAPNF